MVPGRYSHRRSARGRCPGPGFRRNQYVPWTFPGRPATPQTSPATKCSVARVRASPSTILWWPLSPAQTPAPIPMPASRGRRTFHYMVFVVDNTDIYSGSNEVSGITLPGIDYPFSDDMESSGNNWSPEPVNGWTGSHPPRPHSGTKALDRQPRRGTMQTMSIPHWSWPTPSPSPPAPSLSSGTCWTSWPATWLAWRYPPTTGPPGERWPPTPA